MNKKCIYTTIIGGYDNLYTSIDNKKTDGWDYICFTDNKNLKSDFWKIIYVDKPLGWSDFKLSRSIKIEWYNWVGEYDVHVYKDANIIIKCDLDDFLSLKEDYPILIFKHWQRNCIYKEAREVINLRRGNAIDIGIQVSNYLSEGYPHDNGLVECGIMIRENNDENKRFSEAWWNELNKHTTRDQLSFNYILWKNPINMKITESQLRNNNMFLLRTHSR